MGDIERRISPVGIEVESFCLSPDNDARGWIVPDVIPVGLTLVRGEGDIDLTAVMVNLTASVLTGSTATGANIPRARQTLYMILHGDQEWFDRVYRPVVRQFGEETEFTAMADCAPLNEMGGAAPLLNWFERHPDIEFVVIDNLVDITYRTEVLGHEWPDDYRTLSALRAIATERQIAIAVIDRFRADDVEETIDNVLNVRSLAGRIDNLVVFREKDVE